MKRLNRKAFFRKILVLFFLLVTAKNVKAFPTRKKTSIQEIRNPRSMIVKQGSIMGSVTMTTYGIPIPINQFDDIIVNCKKKIENLKPKLTGKPCKVCDKLEEFEKDVKNMKRPFVTTADLNSPSHSRTKRFAVFAAIAIATAIFGAIASSFAIYTSVKNANDLAQLQAETNEVFTTGVKLSKKVPILEEFSKNVSRIDQQLVDYLSLEEDLASIEEIVDLGHNRQKQLKNVIDFARLHRLHTDIQEFTNLPDGIELVIEKMDKHNYTLILPTVDHVFQEEVSYTVIKQQLMVYLHLKIALDTTVHQVYEIKSFPILTPKGKFLNIIRQEKLLTVDESNNRFSFIDQKVFDECKLKWNNVKLCKINGLKFSKSILNDTCEGALFNSNMTNVLQYCGFTKTKPQPIAMKIGEHQVALYSPKLDYLTCHCPFLDEELNRIEYYPQSFGIQGTAILTVEPNCRCNSSLFQYSTGIDLTTVIMGKVDDFEIKFNSQSMSKVVSELTELKKGVDGLEVVGDKEYEERTKVTEQDLMVPWNESGWGWKEGLLAFFAGWAMCATISFLIYHYINKTHK